MKHIIAVLLENEPMPSWRQLTAVPSLRWYVPVPAALAVESESSEP